MIVIAVAGQLIKNIRFIELGACPLGWHIWLGMEMSVSVITHGSGSWNGEIPISFRNNGLGGENGSMEI